MIAAIVLAAGDSARMGSPKALLPYADTTFLGAVLGSGRAAGIDHQIVVVGSSLFKSLDRSTLGDAMVLRAEDPSAGPIGSIRTGIKALNHTVEAVVVWHVDRPAVSSDTVRSILKAFREGRGLIVVPTYRGRSGHPVLFARPTFDELLQAPEPTGARAVVRADPARVVAVPTTDPAVLLDVNTPDDYRALLRRIQSASDR